MKVCMKGFMHSDPTVRSSAVAWMKAAYRTRTASGTEHGINLTTRDLAILGGLARWHAAYVEEVAIMAGKKGPRPSANDVAAVRRRLWRLENVIDDGSGESGPLVERSMSNTGRTVWRATPLGARLGGSVWKNHEQFGPNTADHAASATRLGLLIESILPAGVRLYSEREVRRREDFFTAASLPEWARFTSATGSDLAPDMLIVCEATRRLIPVEVERDRDRPHRVYRDKLRAFYGNFDTSAVWYMLATTAPGNRLWKVAQELWLGGPPRPMRLVVVGPDAGRVDWGRARTGWRADLEALARP